MTETSRSERIHIGFFGLRNSGKSSLVNAVTRQNVSIVSDIKGTTTDPVYKSMELPTLGPVEIIDTPGIDDTGELGQLRVDKTLNILRKVDIAILVVEANSGLSEYDSKLISIFQDRKIAYIIAYSKADMMDVSQWKDTGENEIYLSVKDSKTIDELIHMISKLLPNRKEKGLIGDILKKGSLVVLVIVIDESAPKGRIILPQQQLIRDILDSESFSLVTSVENLEESLAKLNDKADLIITDSQCFKEVEEIIVKLDLDVMLTSFSIIFARYKGNLDLMVKGAKILDDLEEARILIAEACTHHAQKNDIGRVQIPELVRKYTGSNRISFDFSQGLDYENDLSKYDLVIHCGGCMINSREMEYRINQAIMAGTSISNYGLVIAHMNGILDKAIQPFK